MQKQSWVLNNDDAIRVRLKLSISMWYSCWYMGDETKKQIHLSLFDSMFNPSRFDIADPKERAKEEAKFLQELQDIADSLEGYEGG